MNLEPIDDRQELLESKSSADNPVVVSSSAVEAELETVFQSKSECSLSEGPPSTWLEDISSLGERPASPSEGGVVRGDDYRMFYTALRGGDHYYKGVADKLLKRDDFNKNHAFLAAVDACNVDVANDLASDLSDSDFSFEGKYAMVFAAYRGHLNVVQEYFDTNSVTDANEESQLAGMALWLAADQRHLNTVKFLLTVPEVDVNLVDSVNGDTALTYASADGNQEIAIELLAHPGIDVNHANNGGYTAWAYAFGEGFTDIVDALRAKGAKEDYNTALIIASYSGKVAIVKELLAHPGINVNHANLAGETALIGASMVGQVAIVKELLKHPVINVNHASTNGETALSIVCLLLFGFGNAEEDKQAITEALRAAGAK